MPGGPKKPSWRPARDLPFIALVVAVLLGMWRTIDQPNLAVTVAGTRLELVYTDLAFAVLAAFCVLRLLGRAALPRPARAITAAAAAFFGWLLATSALHGAEAFVGAAKLLEYGVLALGVVLFVRRRVQLWLLVGTLVAVNVMAVAGTLEQFVDDPTVRQESFLGAHDFAALSSLSLVVGLARLYAPADGVRTRLSVVAGVVGLAGLILGAAFASLLGVYLAAAALVGLAVVRGAATRRALAVTVATLAVATAGVVGLRSGQLGFIEELFGSPDTPGETAGSWSHRLIHVYIGGRVFLDNPIVGTGWYGELPPSEYAEYLPDARRRFEDQPPHYFPPSDGVFTPQQTYDQILFELGLVGAGLFLVLAAVTVRTASRVGRSWPGGGPDELLAYVPAGWVGALAGALAGAALFGGIPLTSIFWLTLGAVAVAPSLVPAEVPAVRREPRREAALVAG